MFTKQSSGAQLFPENEHRQAERNFKNLLLMHLFKILFPGISVFLCQQRAGAILQKVYPLSLALGAHIFKSESEHKELLTRSFSDFSKTPAKISSRSSNRRLRSTSSKKKDIFGLNSKPGQGRFFSQVWKPSTSRASSRCPTAVHHLTPTVMDFVHVAQDMHCFVAGPLELYSACTTMFTAFGRGLKLRAGTAAAIHIRCKKTNNRALFSLANFSLLFVWIFSRKKEKFRGNYLTMSTRDKAPHQSDQRSKVKRLNVLHLRACCVSGRGRRFVPGRWKHVDAATSSSIRTTAKLPAPWKGLTTGTLTVTNW